MHLAEVESVEKHDGAVWHCEWNSDGSKLASCGSDTAVRIWQLHTRAPHAKHQQQKDTLIEEAVLDGVQERTVRRVSWSPDDTDQLELLNYGGVGNVIAVASFDGTTAIWLLANNEWSCIATLEGHENEVKGVAWSPSGTLLATCGRDKSVWIWEMQDMHEFECVSVMNDHTQDVKCVVWHPRMDVLVSGSYDDTVKTWEEEPDGDDWWCSATLPQSESDIGHTSTVWDISFKPDGESFVSSSDDGSILSWSSPPKGKWQYSSTVFKGNTRPLFTVSWSGSGYICSGSGDNCIRLHSYQADEQAWKLVAQNSDAHLQDVNAVRFNPNHTDLIASASDDGTVKLWRVY